MVIEKWGKAAQRRWSSVFIFVEHAKAGKECWEENLQQTKQHSQITGAKQSGIFTENITAFGITIMWSKKMHWQWVWGRCMRWGYQEARSFKLCRRKWETTEEFKQQYVICMCRCMLLINKRSPESYSVSNVFGFDLLNTQLTVAQTNKGRHFFMQYVKRKEVPTPV